MSTSTEDSSQFSEQQTRETGSMLNYMAARKVSTAMWVMRWYTLLLSFQYMFFCSAFNMSHYFQRAIISNAIICALRLHQRIPDFRLSRVYLALILQEDSAHYLIYSFIFMMSSPITIALMPIVFFALLHACSFSRQLLDMHGCNAYSWMRKLINHVAKHQTTLFRVVAFNEILIFPTIIAMVVMGKAHAFAPFLYYKFLHYRYLSKRNPYSRVVFYEMRMALEDIARGPSCPVPINFAIEWVISICQKLAPSVPVRQ